MTVLRPKLVEEKKIQEVPRLATQIGLQYQGNFKAHILIMLHMLRLTNLLTLPGLMEDLEYILNCSPRLFKSMIQHARVSCGYKALQAAIQLQQHINQAVFPGFSTPMDQLPHIKNTQNLDKKGYTEQMRKLFALHKAKEEGRTVSNTGRY